MKTFVVLLRGVNVGGKNKVPMAELRSYLVKAGLTDARTYIQSGNVLVRSSEDAGVVAAKVEHILENDFNLQDSIKALALSHEDLKHIVASKPAGFGDSPEEFHSDVIFLMGITEAEAFAVFKPKEGVDKVWIGPGVIYSQRLSALRTKSGLNRIMQSPLYKSMTIRNWNTTTKLLALLSEEF